MREMQNFAIPTREKTRAMRLVEAEKGVELVSYLTEQYHDRGLRLADIAAALDLDTGTVSRWMAHFGIETRVRTKAPEASVA
jgi:hypothetical protein